MGRLDSLGAPGRAGRVTEVGRTGLVAMIESSGVVHFWNACFVDGPVRAIGGFAGIGTEEDDSLWGYVHRVVGSLGDVEGFEQSVKECGLHEDGASGGVGDLVGEFVGSTGKMSVILSRTETTPAIDCEGNGLDWTTHYPAFAGETITPKA